VKATVATKAPRRYVKHIYWLPEEREKDLRIELHGRNIRLKSGKAVVCTGLDEITKIISVAPDVWDGTCKRQGSWYRRSDKSGQYLIISSFELKGFEGHKAAVITRSDFLLPRRITREEKGEMVEDEDFKVLVPEEWYMVSDLEKRLWTRWARRLGSKEDWDSLFLTHTACHANFIKPRFTPMAKGSPIRLTGARICVRAVWNFFRLLALHGGRNSLPRAPVRLFSQGCHRTDISWFRNPKGLYPTFFTLLSPLIQENSFGLAGLPGSKGDMPAIGLCRNPFSLV
jgi:hypothetical protein